MVIFCTILFLLESVAIFCSLSILRYILLDKVSRIHAVAVSDLTDRVRELKNMDGTHSLQVFQSFDLNNEDLKLRILYCNQSFTPVSKNIVCIEAKKLPKLPFDDQSFDIALCSHFLFVDSDNLSESFHIEALLELARVATEVRIYPLMDQEGHPSIHLGPVLQMLQQKGFGVELKHVGSSDLKGGNAILRLWNEACVLKENTREATNNI